jgi:hypothetical protein
MKMKIGIKLLLFLLLFSGTVPAKVDLPKDQPKEMEVSQSSVKDSGDQAAAVNSNTAQTTAMIGGALNASGSAILAATCPSWRGCAPSGFVMLGMGVLSMLQSGANSGTAYDASQFASQFDAGSGSGSSSKYKLGSDLPDVTRQLKDELAKNPYIDIDYNKGTLTTKDGKTHKLSDFSSPAAMAAAGFSPEEINAAMGKAKELEAKYVTKYKANELGFEGGGSGGGGSSLSDSASYDGSAGLGGSKAGTGFSAEDMRMPAHQMAGMQKDFNGDPIGVSADSIFIMMNRRYDVKKKQDSFFDEHQAKNRK